MQINLEIRRVILLVMTAFICLPGQISGQPAMPEILETGTLEEQFGYIEERTQIYNNFRAIREVMFQRLRSNSLDSLDDAGFRIEVLNADLENRNAKIDSLGVLLENVRGDLDLAVRNRDSIAFLGMPMHKTGYNFLVWSIIAGLSFLLVAGGLTFLRNRNVLVNTLNEIEELREEYESYRKNSREKREKMTMEHFNEIKKLREGRQD